MAAPEELYRFYAGRNFRVKVTVQNKQNQKVVSRFQARVRP